MRWILFALLTAFTSASINAAEPADVDATYADAAASFSLGEATVIVTPVPTPAQVTILRSDLSFTPEIAAARKLKAAKKLKLAKKPVLPKSMLSRAERQQIALLNAKTKTSSLDWSDNEDAGSGAEDIVLHRSFNRPKLADADDREGADRDHFIPEEVKLRLYLARMKAVEAHALASVPEPEVDDAAFTPAVKLRLLLAREKALAAQSKQFS